MSDTSVSVSPYVIGPTSTLILTPSAGQTTTWDPANKGPNEALSNSNYTVSGTNGANPWESVLSTTSKTTGKYYAEMVLTTAPNTTQNVLFGFCLNNITLTTYLGATGDAGSVRGDNTNPIIHGVVSDTPGNLPTYSMSSGDKIAFALDFTTGAGWVAYNNTWGGSPSAGTNPAFTWTTGSAWFLAAAQTVSPGNSVITIRTAASTLSYTPPSGFSTWD